MIKVNSGGRVFFGYDPVTGTGFTQQNLSLIVDGMNFDIGGLVYLQA
jgi:hypothetical protein